MAKERGGYWRKLDNAAKLYSAANNKKDIRVFRVYCELKDEVDPDILQEALDRTLEKYPVFLSVMRKGLFWHYLEESDLRPKVIEEYREPCSNLYIRDKRELLFEVTYYKKRINFEVFHALTDGTGAIEFVKELVRNYLVLAHKELEAAAVLEEGLNSAELEDDGFAKYYSNKDKTKKKRKEKAYQIKGRGNKMNNLEILEAEVSTKELLQKAKSYGVSITVYLTAVFMLAIKKSMQRRHGHKPVVLMIPVNLRKFFPTSSMLNFFSWIEPSYCFGDEPDDLKKVIEHVKAYFAEELTKQRMAERINEYTSLEVHPLLRLAPLELKNLCISAGQKTSAGDVTAIYSNMGIIKMPEVMEPYIERFGVFTSTPKTEICMISYRDKVHFGFTSRYDSDEIKTAFFNILKAEGIEAEVLDTEYSTEVTADSKGMQLFKMFTFVNIVFAIIALCTDYAWDNQFGISFLITGGIASVWFASATAFYKRHNIFKTAMWELVLITNGCLLWDWLTGWRGWSIIFVFPLVSVAIQTAMLLLTKIYKKQAREYMIYLIMGALYGLIIPLVFVLTNVVEFVVPAVISIGFSAIMLIALWMFRGSEMQEELEKKLHI